MPRILIVEDSPPLARMLSHNLELEGYHVEMAGHGLAAVEASRRTSFDLILLDLMIPGLDGISVLQALRTARNDVPVIVLTAKGDPGDKLRGLRLGADDYVTKPFDLLELLARISAVLRRTSNRFSAPPVTSTTIDLGSVRIDLATRAVERDGHPVHLRPKEFELLVALARRGGALVTRADLLTEVWGYHPTVVSRTLDTHIGELRRKLEPAPDQPQLILTVRKAGFRIATRSPAR